MRPPHAFPVWEIEVEEDDPADEPLANLALGAAMVVLWFALLFLFLPGLT